MKKLHIEWIRIIAIIMVVLNHSDLFYTFYTNTDNAITFLGSLFVSAICKVNVPLFIMITGALLIPKAESWQIIVKKRIVRIFTVLFVCSVMIYMLECFLWHQETFSVGNFIDLFLRQEIQISYWYLYEYIGILLLIPILGFMLRSMDSNTMKYCVNLALFIKVGIEFVNFFTDYNLPFGFFLINDSVFYVIMGYYLENRMEDCEYDAVSYKKIILVQIGCILTTMLLVIADKKIYGAWHEGVLSMLTPISTVCIYMLLKKSCFHEKENNFSRWIRFLGSCTFGVYLIERIGQRIFLNFYIWLCNKTFGLLACSVYVICILGFGFAVIGCLKKSKFIRNYI